MQKMSILLLILGLTSSGNGQNRNGLNQFVFSFGSPYETGSGQFFEFHEDSFSFALEYMHIFKKTFGLGLDISFLELSNKNSADEESLRDIPALAAIKYYFWPAKLQPFIKFGVGPLFKLVGKNSATFPSGTLPGQSGRYEDSKVGGNTQIKIAIAGGVFAGIDWRLLKGLGVHSEAGLLYRNLHNQKNQTFLTRIGLLFRF